MNERLVPDINPLIEEHEAKLRALQQALIEGEQSGDAELFDVEAFLKEMSAT